MLLDALSCGPASSGHFAASCGPASSGHFAADIHSCADLNQAGIASHYGKPLGPAI